MGTTDIPNLTSLRQSVVIVQFYDINIDIWIIAVQNMKRIMYFIDVSNFNKHK